MTLARRLLVANPSMQVSDALSGSISLPSAKREVGDYRLIASVKLNSSASEVFFGSIPQYFQHLQIIYSLRSTYNGGGDNGITTFNGDSGNNYTEHLIEADGGTANPYSSANRANLRWIIGCAGSTTTAGIFQAGIVDVLDYSSSYKTKTLRAFSGLEKSGAGYIDFASGLYNSQTPISSMRITANGQSFIAGSEISIYGIGA